MESVSRNVLEESETVFERVLWTVLDEFLGRVLEEPGDSLGKCLRNSFRKSLERILLNLFGKSWGESCKESWDSLGDLKRALG